jgi:uncharacterized membrane protein
MLFREAMRMAWLPLMLVILMVATPWAALAGNDDYSDVISTELVEQTGTWSAEQAASNWYRAIGGEGGQVEISSGSGMLWPQTGTFDPTLQTPDFSSTPMALIDDADPFATGFLIMQLTLNDGEFAEMLAASVNGEVIDTLPEDAWILRLPAGNPQRAAAILTLAESPLVRWVGSQHPAWRLDLPLHQLAGSNVSLMIDIDLTPAPDLTQRELETLESDLISTGAEQVRCDLWLCQVRAIDSHWLASLTWDHRLLFIAAGDEIAIVNNYARSITRIDALRVNHNGGLDGSGEVGALSDSGIDADHGDFTGRVRGVYNNYGPDNSAADANSGHGTHVSATMLGDGTGDGNARGVAHAATFHFYQLEHDQSGQLARWGSLYDMFRHSWQNNARTQSNSWGAQSSWGQYTSDSRSADSFMNDYTDFLVLFAAGNEGSQGASSIAPPATAKNVLTVGASTTGRPGTAAAGSVASFSSIGPTADGRIKPDIVAPGVQICSARAEEATQYIGPSCSSSSHGSGGSKYVQTDGTSASTPVVGGAAMLARQFLREELGIPSARSDLVKAILINGAKDLGSKNIPNMDEGWGQLDLEESLYPQSGVIAKNIFWDTSQTLSPGYSYLYTYNLDASYGVDITLVWNDREGSSSASQSSARLVNDLDLIVTAPDGTVYKGNVFSSGLSTTGGSKDSLNNVERVRFDSGDAGDWSIQVSHSGGYSQSYAVIVSGVGNENPMSDLAVFSGSLWASQTSPLENDWVLIRPAWVNQAPAATPSYHVSVEDLSTSTMLWEGNRSSLAGGTTDTFSFQHQFVTIGVHTIKLIIDTRNDVVELNDEVDGVNNNVATFDINVTAIGVRITSHLESGALPSTEEEVEESRTRTLDPTSSSEVFFDLTLANEGTADEDIELVVTPVQEMDENGIFNAPQDLWSRVLSEDGPWMLNATGGIGNTIQLSLTLTDEYANPDDPEQPRYALPGTFIVDLTAFYRMTPSVSHTIRLTIEVERVEGIQTAQAGTTGLGAKPGEYAAFSLSVLNTGNGPTTYQVECETPNRWLVELGNGNSSSVVLEPLSRLQFLPLQVRVRVPAVSNGQPAAGNTEVVECIISSLNDPLMTTTESATVEVFQSTSFRAELFDGNYDPLGPFATVTPVAVQNGETVIHTLELENEGNIEFDLTVMATPGLNTWGMEITAGPYTDDRTLTLTLQPGIAVDVTITVLVPGTVSDGDENQINIRTERTAGDFVLNSTRLVVEERVDFNIILPPSGTIVSPLGQYASAVVSVENSGNVDLLLNWSFGTLPDGWTAGFLSNPPTTLAQSREASVQVSLFVPAGTDAGPAGSLSIIIDARTLDDSQQLQKVGMLGVVVESTAWVALQSNITTLIELHEGAETTGIITISNNGNTACSATISVAAPDGWNLSLDRDEWQILNPGQSEEVYWQLIAGPNPASISNIWLNVTVTAGDGIAVTEDGVELQVKGVRSGEGGGLLGWMNSVLPTWVVILIIFLLIGGAVLAVVLLGRSGDSIGRGEELIPAGEVLGAQAQRRDAALDIGLKRDEQTSGLVSESEIEEAIAQSKPQLSGLPPLPVKKKAGAGLPGLPSGLPPAPSKGVMPAGLPPLPNSEPVSARQGDVSTPTPPPLPASGLPDGWTAEQWKHYGHEYLRRVG